MACGSRATQSELCADLPRVVTASHRLSSSLRLQSAEASYKRAARLMSRFGISRVTDITRLDKLGLPVHASVRPRGQGLRVHAGKGLHVAESRIGALMEGIEFAAADPRRNPVGRPMSVATLQAGWAGAFRLVDLAPRRGVPVDGALLLPVLECEDLIRKVATALPTELLFVSDDKPPSPPLFGSNTNGVASGNSLDEATLHGLLEVLERDALSLEQARHTSRRVHDDSLPPHFIEMAEAWLRRGVRLVVRNIPSDTGLPCFKAWLIEPESTDINLCSGSGLHLDREIALTRAICEAAQSRLSTLHGGRDDIVGFYDKYTQVGPARRREREARLVAAVEDTDGAIAFSEVEQIATAGKSLPALPADLLERLRSIGLGSVLRYRFAADLDGMHALRIVVPRCECSESDLQRMGPRLMSAVMNRD
jgi:ribosomal protein S12 methylthiotransferase accessory factor